MGRKRTRQRKHVSFHFVCIVVALFLFSGCIFTKKNIKIQQEQVGQLSLYQSKDLMVRGEYEAALKKNLEILQSFPEIGDQALFQIGLIYAHPKYAGRNYKTSSSYFQKIISEFSESDLRNQAEIWSLFLNKVVRKDTAIREQNKKISALRKKLNSIEKEMETGIKERDELRKEIDSQDKEINELNKQIEQLKQIDLTIEEKKRKSLP